MLVSYFAVNFMTLMIMMALAAIMGVNRDVKIPATKMFVMCIMILFALTVVGTLDVYTDVSAMTADEAAKIVKWRLITSTLGYILRPLVILTEILIILENNKFKLLCIIPAVINTVVYSTALFGSTIAFTITPDNYWIAGPLRITVFVTQFVYLGILLFCSVQSFCKGEKIRPVILMVIFLQAVLVALHEYGNTDYPSYSNEVTALCVLEYYVFLTNIYRQELTEKLDAYVDRLEEAGGKLKSLTVEVMEALASAIDAKDKYTHGHSSRVAEYSRKLAAMNFKSEQECDEIYYAALLHDVGKIGISDSIITKEGKLTKEEYEEIKKHPVLGTQILQRISEFPYLSIGAGGHHERYDGKGYPYGLKGSDIPEIARIISVADAYDAMSSKRSYRDPIPQQIVREELVKGAGTQFDPEYARLMLHLIDVDTEYEMCEREEVAELAGRDELVIDEYRSRISSGILLTPLMTTLHMKISALEKSPELTPVPSMILFDSLDGRYHENEKEKKDLNYFEYGQIWLDGSFETGGARKIQAEITENGSPDALKNDEYRIEAVKIRDHALIRIIGKEQIAELIVALPDSARFAYIGLTGEHCRISHVSVEKAETESPSDYIPRIAEAISYIDGPVGDMPNVQADGYRTAASEGIVIRDGLTISFHAKCLPTARLVWHCPFIDIFCSDDGKVNGDSYRDLAFLRFDGEAWECDPNCSMKLNVNTLETFEGWDAWKKRNQEGFDAVVTFKVEDNKITTITENAGISIRNTAILTDIKKPVYTSITGDQVAITNIRVN